MSQMMETRRNDSSAVPLDSESPIRGELEASFERRLEAIEARLPRDRVAIVVFSDDMDKVLAGFVIANGALAMGMEVSMYFTFMEEALKSRMTIFL